jgi:hypothetical protein
MTNTKLLNEKIVESGLKRKFIAEKLGLSTYGLQRKIENVTEFKASEISALCDVLDIKTVTEKEKIFFAN